MSQSVIPTRAIAANFDAPDALLEYEPASQQLMHSPVSLIARRISWLVSALVLGSIFIMTVFPINRVVSAPGRVIAIEPTTVLQPLETSIVRSIDVHEGQLVHP